ncbi:hypothetical protein JAAARDRAFT_144988 [Jaapia argillacea MUCL 33604]|uniref:20S-pre-rRNA D-site endonuclease NOB1 n=1 Tax=Jaapia argillacea MUCL 33604 TaxID=933084 RepID=A0A067QLG6_9AGAM|nr:hypothetical protein JAAARDRAFT_144988 [Jaapia argillacea MUCL 33604]
MTSDKKFACKNLVLDAGPLLSLSPLRGLAETYYTVPQVLSELKDQKAREHFERLGLNAGVRIDVQSPDAASLAQVIQFAKKTGDYGVLSHADLCVLALTYALHQRAKAEEIKVPEPALAAEAPQPAQDDPISEVAESMEQIDLNTTSTPLISDSEVPPTEAVQGEDGEEPELDDGEDLEEAREPLHVELQRIDDPSSSDSAPIHDEGPESSTPTTDPLFDDPSDEDDGEGEWITPENVALHKSRHLDLLPNAGSKLGQEESLDAGCMTADFAMQNVLLQMGLNLVGVEGKRIQKVKTWVLRCHACFKICKDSTKKFCPSCGNPTLLRASVTVASPDAAPNVPAMQVHLKKNFQYKTRGTIYSIPSPKPGSAKKGNGEGLILREDQIEYQRAKKRADAKRERDEKKMFNSAIARGAEGGATIGSWMDPDWVPEILSVGAGGKGRSMKGSGDMPTIGYGRRNPNEKRRPKK